MGASQGRQESSEREMEGQEALWEENPREIIYVSPPIVSSPEFKIRAKEELKRSKKLTVEVDLVGNPGSTEEASRINKLLSLVADLINRQQAVGGRILSDKFLIEIVGEEPRNELVLEGFSRLSLQPSEEMAD